MLSSITNSLSGLFGNVVSSLLSQVASLAPSLLTGALSTAANTVLPGSGVLVQAFIGPIVDSGVQALTTGLSQAFLPALSDAGLANVDLSDLAGSLGNSFLDGIRQGIGGG